MRIVGSAEQRGFNLIELSLVLTLILVLAGLAQSKLSELFFKHRLQNQANQLLVYVQIARQFALSQFTNVTLCPSVDKIECSAEWSLPLITFIDDNKNGVVDNDDHIVSVKELIPDLVGNRRMLHFVPTFSAGNIAATLKICRFRANRSWRKAVVISNMGRVRLEQNQNKISC